MYRSVRKGRLRSDICQNGSSGSKLKEHMPRCEISILSAGETCGKCPLYLIQTFVFDRPTTTPGLPRFFFSRHPYLYRTTSHTARLPHGATNYPMELVVETYAILLKRLADAVYDLFTALGCIMLYITVLAAFPNVYLSATFYITVTSIISVTPSTARSGLRQSACSGGSAKWPP